jgi:hypothetical protein
MINYVTHLMPQAIVRPPLRGGRPKPAAMLVLALGTLALTGCFRATGLQRNAVAAEVLPATGGDTVAGLKSKAGAGDLYLGNDFIQVAIDSTVYQDPNGRVPMAGARSGGSIVDAGYFELDASYNRVSMPGTVMNRLTPVVNQDPELPVVFSSYQTQNSGGLSSIVMTGAVYDGSNKLGTGSGVVSGVAVTQTISVAQLNHYFTLSTVVTNNSANPVGIKNVGDCLIQQGGGYRFNIPAIYDASGSPLDTGTALNPLFPWGMQLVPDGAQPNHSDFETQVDSPLTTSVQAPEVGLISSEPGSDCLDSHCSLGFLPLDAPTLLVAADAQDVLTLASNIRPAFPQRLAVGSLPAANSLAPGASLSFNRRLYIVGGRSVDTSVVGGLAGGAAYPDQGNGLFNAMDLARYGDTSIPYLTAVQDMGLLSFTVNGTSQRQGPLPTEIRIERNLTGELPTTGEQQWQLQRVEYLEPNENLTTTNGLAPSTLSVWLPLGYYRMTLRTQNATQVRTTFENTSYIDWVNLSTPIWIQRNQSFTVSTNDVLCPDGLTLPPDPGLPPYLFLEPESNQLAPITRNTYSLHYFTTRESNSPLGSLQPLRITFVGTPNPVMRRQRTMGSFFNAITSQPSVAPGTAPGQYQFRANNEMFGSGFTRLAPTTFVWLPNNSSFTAYGSRGPLEDLQSLDLSTSDTQTNINHTFTVTNLGLPPGWASFDMPGPTQATTGAYLPAEQLASALANGVQVIANPEQDLQITGSGLYSDFLSEFGSSALSAYMRPASLSAVDRPINVVCGTEPYVLNARSSTLTGFGTAAALFTPNATNAANGGALPNTGWTLSDFITQAQGQYNVVLRPRGPDGLFTQQGAPLGATDPAQNDSWNTNLHGWWTGWSAQSGPLTFGGVTDGSFDALELLRGESLAALGPAAWFQEFLQVRSDWFALLNYQTPTAFTKALGLSSALNSVDTPVGLARTYLQTVATNQNDLSGVQTALQSGAAVASTGPFIGASIGTAGPGQLVPGPVSSVTLTVQLYKPDWMPVNELRVVVNGRVVKTINPAIGATGLTAAGTDPRLYTGSFNLDFAQLSGGQNAWVVVEAGVPLASGTVSPVATNPADPNTVPWQEWNTIMRGIYPVAVTNPIFINVTGGGYTSPTNLP